MSALPNGWIAASLEEVAQVNPRLDKSEIDADLEVSFVPMPAVEAESGKIDVSAKRRFSEVEKGYTGFKENDVLFAKITPCMENGKMAVVPEVHGGLGFGSTEFHVLRPPEGIVPKYLYYFVSSKSFRMNAEHNMTGAVGQRRVPTTYFSQADIPLPPAAEQRRIVGKVEELFSELDEGVANLKQARAQLAVYRQALLKHAFEGHLTADWRTKHAPELESADQLLARIRTEREERYQKQLKDWSVNREGRQPRSASPVEHLTSDELANFANCPTQWCVVRLGEIISVASGAGLTSGAMVPGEHFVYGGNGVSGKHAEYMFDEPRLIIGRVGAKCGAIHVTATKSWVTDNALVVDILCNVPSMPFLKLKFAYDDFNRLSVSTAQPVVSGARLYAHIIALPPSEEQQIIVDKLEAQISALDALEADIDLNLQKAEALRQSILKKAFAGELVPQDPADEPAAALLARIRAEREAQPVTRRTRR